ncbi:hypothetical protein LSH36_1895g00000 [Paralvinella palmiformis]|uniref:Uncharacterized protein n=1 Tax=Paralvinella palmiformis TaxID=53620 RepID=A0AAD9IQW2_9ANNE|nr:hypothetical protein LSH36_1895g00000 [Paralvinella palmiformis]
MAMECRQQYVAVTYDIAVVKLVMQVQCMKAPLCDNVFIWFKRLRPILASAFQILHFSKFLELNGPIPESLTERIAELVNNPSPELMENIEGLIEYDNIMMRYPNRPDYSKWMVKNHLNLFNMEDNSHPGIKQVLCNGALSIRRTYKNLPRGAVELTLEKTINIDAALRHTGIAAFSHSDSALQRWMLTRSARSAIIGKLIAKAGLKSPDDVTKSLKTIPKNDIESTMNPFCVPPRERLFNIMTGRDVPDNVRDDPVDCQKIGKNGVRSLLMGALKTRTGLIDQSAFRAIATKTMIWRKDDKLLELRRNRDLFGRLLYISAQHNIDLARVFTYHLVPAPPTLSHVDGTPNKTDKSKLMNKQESLADSTDPTAVDITFLDAFFYFIRCRIYLTHMSSTVKAAFFRFISVEWRNQPNVEIIRQHHVCLALDEICFLYRAIDGEVRCQYVPTYHCQHEEADHNSYLKSPPYTHVMSQLGNQDEKYSDVMLTIESFVCALYGYLKDIDVDKFRNNMFRLKYVPQQEQDPLLKITGMNPSTMLQYHSMLVNKVKRANFVSAMWKKACTRQPVIISLVDNGWLGGTFPDMEYPDTTDRQTLMNPYVL